MKPQPAAVQVHEKPAGPKIVKAENFFDRMKGIYDMVSQRAFELFEKRGFKNGFDLQDWLFAEKELLHPVPIEIKELLDYLLIRAEVPGFDPADLEISIEPNRLIISGKTEKESKKEVKKITYTELYANEIFRTIDLPAKVETDKVTATLRNGILNVVLPKAVEPKPTTVEVKDT